MSPARRKTHHRRRFAVGDGGKDPEEYKGMQNLHLPVGTDRQANLHQYPAICRSPKPLMKRQGGRLLRKKPDPRGPAEGIDQQAADEIRAAALGAWCSCVTFLPEEIEAALAGRSRRRRHSIRPCRAQRDAGSLSAPRSSDGSLGIVAGKTRPRSVREASMENRAIFSGKLLPYL